MSDLYNCPVCHSSGPCQHSHPAVPAREPEAAPLDRYSYAELHDELKHARARVSQLEQEQLAARTELKKYLKLADEETIVGAIRNLAQVAYSNEDVDERAEKAEAERDTLREVLELAEQEMRAAYQQIIPAYLPGAHGKTWYESLMVIVAALAQGKDKHGN